MQRAKWIGIINNYASVGRAPPQHTTDRMQLKVQPNLVPTPADYIAFPANILCVHKQLPSCSTCTVANT